METTDPTPTKGREFTDGMLLYLTEYSHSGECSIGVAVNQGFLTAGHCTYGFNTALSPSVYEDFRDGSFNPLGLAQFTTFSPSGPIDPINPRDAAWVQTLTGWTPTAEINGYSDGVLTVPAKWSGMAETPISFTVCRYGATSGGPYCGTVSAKNVTECFGDDTYCEDVGGLTRVSNVCTDDGDSGGPYVDLATGQVQGTNTGGQKSCASYPSISGDVYFQPVSHGLALTGRTMLTAHGAVAPAAEDLSCDPMGYSTFSCYTSYRSQGSTSISWSSSHGGGATGTVFNGSCTAGLTVTVTVTLTNPYGSSNASRFFHCYGGPPP